MQLVLDQPCFIPEQGCTLLISRATGHCTIRLVVPPCTLCAIIGQLTFRCLVANSVPDQCFRRRSSNQCLSFFVNCISWENLVQTCCSGDLAGQHRHTSPTSSSSPRTSKIKVVITDFPLHTVVDCHRSNLSSCYFSCLERTTMPQHVCTTSASFLQLSEDSSVQLFFPDFVPVKWRVIYLFIYLL